jgi:hypothetical protein
MILRLWPAFPPRWRLPELALRCTCMAGHTPYHDVRYYLKHAPERQQRIAWCQANPAAQRTDCGNAPEAKILKP